MTDSLQEDLLGYALGALDDERAAEIERYLAEDPDGPRHLAAVRRALAPLEAARREYEPPADLAARTCRFVLGRAPASQPRAPLRAAALVGTHERPAPVAMEPVAPPLSAEGHFHWQDLLMAAGVIVAASLLLFPAIQGTRAQARLLGCQGNLRELGTSLTKYSELHGGVFPQIPAQGRLAAASAYAPILAANELLPEHRLVVCPDSPAAKMGSFHVPTLEEIEAIDGPESLAQLQETMGGSYGYTLGYQIAGRYRPVKNLRRPHFAIAADAPCRYSPDRLSENHGRLGQNVLFEDGHVRFTLTAQPSDLGNNFYVNDKGMVAAGIQSNDAVVAAGATPPLDVLSRPGIR